MQVTRVNTAVIAGNFPWVLVRIEIALWDLLGRAHKPPISTFFGDEAYPT